MKTEARDRLTAILTDGIDVHRCAAARALGSMGLPESAAPLVAALLDEDPDVRTDAAFALGELNDPATAAKLMENLVGDPESDVKRAAIKALIAMRYEPLVPLLRKLAVSRSENDIAWDEGEFYTDEWDSWVDIQMSAFEGLGVFAPEEAVPEILEAMLDEEAQDLTEPGLRALARMGEAGALAIIGEYGKGDTRMCRRIVRAVGMSDNPHLDDLRGGMIADVKPEIRRLALENLDAADDRLKPLFGDEDSSVRASVVKHAGLQNTLLLWDLIKDPAPEVRVEVFKIIKANPDQFKDEDLVSAVQKAITGDPEAAKQAALALIALKGPEAAKGLLHVLANADIPQKFRVGVIEAIERAGEIAVPALLQAAGDEDRQLRLAALTALAEIAGNDPKWPNDAGLGLIAGLNGELVLPPEDVEEDVEEKEPLPEITEEIANEIDAELPLVAEKIEPVTSTLEAIKTNVPDAPVEEPEEIVLSEETQRFVDMTKRRKLGKRKLSWDTMVSPHEDVQRFSARLLGGVVHKDVTDALIATLTQDLDEETRNGALFSLAKHGEKTGTMPKQALAPLQEFLKSDVSETRVLALRSMGWIKGAEMDAAIEALLTDSDPLVRVEAVKAMDHRNLATDALINALNDKYQGVGIAAARALARLFGDDSAEALVLFAVTNDGTYRRDIGKLLGQYAPDAGAARLLELLGDEDQKARWLVAIDALAELFQQPDQPEALKVA
ncbi:MAG: HEAT repeat domain-containing protein [Marinosulfonomonas sp.]|nr:HEAT repeat domain-containing protein [Marinosulfonomonas sp.]